MLRPALALAFLAPVVLVDAGCKSPLVEFKCSQNEQCGELAEFAQCEQSGYCSFFDPTCLETGFRFGESSGEESGLCVSGDGTGEPTKPIAEISDLPTLPCDETAFTADGVFSEAFGDAELVEFAWTIRHAGSLELVDSFAGPPEAPVRLDIHRRGGSFEEPRINLAPYHGIQALHAVVDSPPRENIFQNFPQEIALDAGTYRLFFAAAKDDPLLPGEQVTVALRNGIGDTLQAESFPITGEFVGYRHEIVVPAPTPNDAGLALEFRLADKGDYWLDNVQLVNVTAGVVITRNDSAEGGSEPWLLGDTEVLSGDLFAERIPNTLLQPRSYVIELVVKDSNGLLSDPAMGEIVLPDCGDTGF